MEFYKFWLMVWLISGLIFGGLCGYIATEKRRSGPSWFFAGLLLGIVAVIALAAIPTLTEEEIRRREEEAASEEDKELKEWREKMKGPTK